MKIVVLDADPASGSAAAGGADLDFSALEKWGTVEVHQRTSAPECAARIADADIVLTNKVVLGNAELAAAPRLQLICVLATGVNCIDLEAAKEKNVRVCNVPGYSTASTAQHAFALLLELTNHVGEHARAVAQGDWQKSPSFAFFSRELTELEGLTFGIFGLGAIGYRVALIAQAFGMRVIACTRTQRHPEIEHVSLSELLRKSDVLSLHAPLTKDTKNLIDAQALAQMKPSALLLNVARGPLVDERALAEALSQGRLRGAGLDVLCQEAPRDGSAILQAPNVVITPHIAWASRQARERLIEATAQNIALHLKQTPQNIVA